MSSIYLTQKLRQL